MEAVHQTFFAKYSCFTTNIIYDKKQKKDNKHVACHRTCIKNLLVHFILIILDQFKMQSYVY